MIHRSRVTAILALAALLTPSTALLAAPTAAQRATLKAAEAAAKRAGNLYKAKKFAEAGNAAREAQESLDKLGSDGARELKNQLAPLEKQLSRARELLAAEGVKLPAPQPAADSDAMTVSFTRQVAPILVAKCGGCHVQRSRGDFSMASYTALSKGSPGGTVIMAGDAKGSRLVELIESGDMPRGGAKVTPEELALLSNWINAEARFDGPDSAAPLSSFASPGTPAAMPAAMDVVAAKSDDAVQFARDIGAIFVSNCLECHGDQNPRNNFSVSNFRRMLRGGDSGAVVLAGKPDESLLIKKLKGTATGARMPQGRDPLSDEQIAKIEDWIRLGARYDGGDPAMPLENAVAQIRALGLTHEELSQERVALAEKHWRLILPDTESHREETPNVLVVGSVSNEILSDVARVADEQVGKLRKSFKIPANRPFVKGRLTLFVFDKRYDYGEIGTMLEQREIPSTWRGHWSFNPLDAYGCVLLGENAAVPPGVVAQQITGAYLASLGRVPRWFAEGSARVIASRTEPKDPRVRLWDDSIGRILSSTDQPAGFLTGDLPAEDSDILSYSFAKYLMTSTNRFSAMLAALEQGAEFDAAFAKAYANPPAELIEGWVAKAAKRK